MKHAEASTLYQERTLTSIITGDGVAPAGLPMPDEFTNDPNVFMSQTYLEFDAFLHAHLPIREGGFGLKSSDTIKSTAYIG